MVKKSTIKNIISKITMTRYIQIKTHPILFLLYLEWILLLIVTLAELLPNPILKLPISPLNLFCIAVLLILGLRLPKNGLDKVIYTIVEVLIILLGAIAGGIRLFPLLYLILVIRSFALFQKWGRIAVMVVAFALFVITLIYRFFSFSFPFRPAFQDRLEFILFSLVIFFTLVLLLLFLLINAVLSERKSRQEAAIANALARQYALNIEDLTTLQEGNRIASEMHDSLLHSLTALNLQIETALKLWRSHPTKAEYFLGEAKKLGSTALNEVRACVSTLRAVPVEGGSLQSAIAQLVESFHRTTGVLPTCSIYLLHTIPNELKVSVYRIVQEALNNIFKHAGATRVEIQIMTTSTHIYIIIDDNGKGFNLRQNTTGVGLQKMRDRTAALSGQLEIQTSPRNGCRITASFPLIVSA